MEDAACSVPPPPAPPFVAELLTPRVAASVGAAIRAARAARRFRADLRFFAMAYVAALTIFLSWLA